MKIVSKEIINEKQLAKVLLFEDKDNLGLNTTQKRVYLETDKYEYDFIITRVKKIKGGNEL